MLGPVELALWVDEAARVEGGWVGEELGVGVHRRGKDVDLAACNRSRGHGGGKRVLSRESMLMAEVWQVECFAIKLHKGYKCYLIVYMLKNTIK